jgi:hypothetical protein
MDLREIKFGGSIGGRVLETFAPEITPELFAFVFPTPKGEA